MINKDELTIQFTIQYDSYKKGEIMANILEFLKELDIVKLEMTEE